jgi:hypothetical protein
MKILTRHTEQTTRVPSRVGAPYEVELTDAEVTARDEYSDLLDRGYTYTAAAQEVLIAMPDSERTADFARWLSDDQLTVDHSGLVIRVHP